MIKCYFDGACEPMNPGGNLGIGSLILHDNVEVLKYSGFVEASRTNSNNVAEYMALEKILMFLKGYDCKEETIFIYGDSMMVINQMRGSWRIKHGMYKETALRCKKLIAEISKKLEFKWIPREVNQC